MKRIRSGTRPSADNGADEFSFFVVRPDPLPTAALVVAAALVLAIGASAGVMLMLCVARLLP
ncbi:MAG: hypothetical protein BGN87_06490 [Rhizobiales bacterium 65-79]|jgi:hypothetical protein|nr:hypothetical protein [Hyphomicrobiales bacterium]OJU02838.1 MAG: hypothetical protein BGN87_06490 [Rhizobiales bacterium 65-79]